MKDTDKVTLTLGQLKRLIKESLSPRGNRLFDAYNIKWLLRANDDPNDFPEEISNIEIPNFGSNYSYMKDVYIPIRNKLEKMYGRLPRDFEAEES